MRWKVFKHLVVYVIQANRTVVWFRDGIPEFVKRERIIIRLQIIGFKFEVMVISVVSETMEFSAIVVERWVIWESVAKELVISSISVISVLFTFRCLMLVEGDFPAILRTIDQTFL